MIRLPTLLDAEELFALVDKNRKRLKEFLPSLDYITKVEDIREFIKKALIGHANGESFVNLLLKDNKIIGCLGLNTIDNQNRSAEVGYWIDEDFSGKGLLTTALKELTTKSFEKFNIHRIVIKASTQNPRSCAVAERLGFKLEGTLKDSEFLYDHYVSHNVYAITKDDWIHCV